MLTSLFRILASVSMLVLLSGCDMTQAHREPFFEQLSPTSYRPDFNDGRLALIRVRATGECFLIVYNGGGTHKAECPH